MIRIRWAGHAAGAVARAMGQEEPDLYRDTWVRYLGEHRERGADPGNRALTLSTDIGKRALTPETG